MASNLFTPFIADFLNCGGGICANSGPTTAAQSGSGNGVCWRFMATETKDIKSVVLSCSSVSSPGTFTVRIETVDTTSGLPTGTLYDANATKQFTPASGTNTVTFDTLPTTGLTVGTMYAMVLLKDNATGSATLRLRTNPTGSAYYPGAILTATDGTTRTNFAEVASAVGIGALILEDDTYAFTHVSPAYAHHTSNTVYGTDRIGAMKIVTTRALSIRGIIGYVCIGRVGTPAGDLLVRVYDSGNSVVSGLSWTVDKDDLTNSNARGLSLFTDGVVALPAGTYRIAFYSPDSANSSNCWYMRAADILSSTFLPTGYASSFSSDASTSFTWTDTDTRLSPIGLWLDAIPTNEYFFASAG